MPWRFMAIRVSPATSTFFIRATPENADRSRRSLPTKTKVLGAPLALPPDSGLKQTRISLRSTARLAQLSPGTLAGPRTRCGVMVSRLAGGFLLW
jgi:hypothetical protein